MKTGTESAASASSEWGIIENDTKKASECATGFPNRVYTQNVSIVVSQYVGGLLSSNP